MCKRLIFLISFVLLLGPAYTASAVNHYWDDGDPNGHLWSLANNWDVNTEPNSLDLVFLNDPNHPTCLVDSTVSAVAYKLRVGYNTGPCYLNITGGTLTTGTEWECEIGSLSGSVGTVTMSDGTWNITGGGGLWVGNYGNGTLTMTAGTINISTSQTNQGLNIPKNTGTGHLDLHGGTINVTNKDFFMRAGGGTGTMDITTGTLVVDGDEESKIEGYVASGWITAYSGDGGVVVDYNAASDQTTVTAYSFMIENFESYTDDNDLRLTWIDGTDGNNSTGSAVYLGTDFFVRRSGSQAMEYDYDNSTSPYYSEANCVFSPAEDWTGDDANYLVLYFHGTEYNVNNVEPMYVVLEDADSNAVITYNGDANNFVQQDGQWWNTWNIELQDFSDSGIDLSNVTKLTIGFGDRDNPSQGGYGTVYFDDIKRYEGKCPQDYNYTPAGDFARDGAINFEDYAKLADLWLTTSSDPNWDDTYDLDANDAIALGDFRLFTNDWVWPNNDVDVTVDAGTIQHQISPYLTGMCPLYTDVTDSLRAEGKITDYLTDAGVGAIRFPGGEVIDYYHYDYPDVPREKDAWQTDPTKKDYSDPNNWDSNFMDVNEYLEWCAEIGAEPVIGINMESGLLFDRVGDSVNEAVNILTHCNITNDYNVTYWFFSNESYGNVAHYKMTVGEYADQVKLYGQAMRAVDPNIKFIACWYYELNEPNYWNQWEDLIYEANEYIDIADVHWYWDDLLTNWNTWLSDTPMNVRQWCANCYNDYSPGSANYMGSTYTNEIQRFYDEVSDINGVSYDIKLATLEWCSGKNTGENTPSAFQRALMHAEMIGQFIEGDLYMALFYTLYQAYQPLRVFLDYQTYDPHPTYFVHQMYSNVKGQQSISSQTDLVAIRPVAALSQDGNTLWVYLLNKTADAIVAKVDISSFTPVSAEAIAFTALGGDVESNSGGLEKLAVSYNSWTENWESSLPPYSLTMLTFQK